MDVFGKLQGDVVGRRVHSRVSAEGRNDRRNVFFELCGAYVRGREHELGESALEVRRFGQGKALERSSQDAVAHAMAEQVDLLGSKVLAQLLQKIHEHGARVGRRLLVVTVVRDQPVCRLKVPDHSSTAKGHRVAQGDKSTEAEILARGPRERDRYGVEF